MGKLFFWSLILIFHIQTLALETKVNNDFRFMYYEDKTSGFEIDKIQSLAISNWKTVQTKNFKHSSSAFWLRLEVVNNSEYENWILCSKKTVDYQDVYLVKNKHIVYESHVGAKVAYDKRDIPHRYCLFPLHLKQNVHYTMYIRLKSEAIIRFEISLYEKDAFAEYNAQNLALQTFFYGCFFILIIYNAAVGFFTRNIVYLYYCLYFVGLNIFFLLQEGFLAVYNTENIQDELHILSILCTVLCFYLFVYQLLDIKAHLLRFRYFFHFFIAALPSSSCLYFIGIISFRDNIKVFIASILFLAFTLPWITWKIRHENRYVIYFGIGWLAVCLATIANILQTEGFISGSVWNDNIYKMIIAFEGIVFSFALVDRINEEKDAKLRLQEDLHTYQEQEKLRLQTMVDEKTILLQQAIAKVKKSSRAKSEFLALMSHELRTPLNAIMGFSYMLGQQKKLHEKTRKDLQIIYQSGEHLLNIINMVLDLSKIEAKQMELELQDVDFDEFLYELRDIFSFKAQQKNIQFVFTSDVPRYIHCDKTKLKQILLNILANALKFTEQGSIHFKVTSRRVLSQEVHLVFEVRDTGSGIDSQEIDKVFQPFLQTKSGLQKEGGIGLGMSISLKFAQLMGGGISVDSIPKKGTTVTLEIQATVSKEISKKSPEVTPLITQQYPKISVLIADDKEVNRSLLKKILRPFQFQIYEASTGEQAIELWKKYQPPLILMDIHMPELNGCEVTERIKKLDKKVIIIAVTASAFPEDKEAMIAAGCNEILVKPVNPLLLLKIIQKHLNVDCEFRQYNSQDSNRTCISLQGLSKKERQLLRQAAIEANMDEINSIIQRTPQLLQERLNELACNFAYEEIVDLIDNCQE